MDVRFDKASRNEPAGEIDYFGLNPKMRLQRDDFSILDSNIGAAAILAGKPCVPQNEVHVSSLNQPLVLTEIGAHKRGIGAHLRRRACLLYAS